MLSRLAIVVPCAADSLWIEPLLPHLEGAGGVFVVSEADGGGSWVAVDTGAGFAERANAGVAEAARQGFTRILLLNDDTVPEPGALEVLACERGIVGAVLRDWDGPTVQQAGIDLLRGGRIKARTRAPTAEFEAVDAVSGAAMAFDLKTWSDLGGFDEGYRFYFEDIDFCLRAEGPVRVARDAVVRHRGGGTRSHRSPDAAFHLGRSHARFARRLGGGRAKAGGRLGVVAAAGTAWTLRSVGPKGLLPLWRGLRQGALGE
jgi:N-acetylglucosaminyl-diphospho-decaprenol L-rhamnosyltransferase